MCLIMTFTAAVITTVIWYTAKKNKCANESLLTLVFMYWGASLMWCIDGFSAIMTGEAFFDISMADTILGIIIIASGAAAYGILSLIEKMRRTAKAQ